MRTDDPEHESYSAQEIRFTTKGEALYAILMDWPGQQAVITALASGEKLNGKVARVEMLGHKGNLKFTADAKGLIVSLPSTKPCDYAYVLKITRVKL